MANPSRLGVYGYRVTAWVTVGGVTAYPLTGERSRVTGDGCMDGGAARVTLHG